ncbi:threonine ammonia-lyase [Amycolatopsis jejuensis]|uniref:threonine ammonia-lyase n=1 Tax=Amycolatopsis jejuensis TaxID=330084 RepID=UPI0005243D6A|nr:pyridoxal-phosphate dependent enzyme [Amycolatopsis jejuensis]
MKGPEIADIEAAAERIAPYVPQSPVVEWPGAIPIRLKLENLLPTGSFKIRGAAATVLSLTEEERARGIVTPSAGNMARAAAWLAHRLGIKCTAVVPEHAPRAKTDALAEWGTEVVRVPFADWWQIMETGVVPGHDGTLVHPFADPRVMAGNGTAGLEIAATVPEVATVVVPFGGGGLSIGIAAAVKARNPRVRVLAAEVSTSAAFSAALGAGGPADSGYVASWVDGIGSPRVAPDLWQLANSLLDGSIVVELDEVAAAVRALAGTTKVVAEGAGATALAAALSGKAGNGPIVCVISGGNLDLATLRTLLDERPS